MAATPQFDFYEKVIIVSSDPAKAQIDGQLGAILGRVCDDDCRWSYAVSIYQSGSCWSCWESELEPTGEFDVRDTFYDGSSVRISQSGELLG